MRIMSKSDALHAAAGFAVTVAFWVLCLLTSFELAFGMLAGAGALWVAQQIAKARKP
jgi:hypothetical protein